jgi:subtilisin family serine protease/fibronectin type 3 domain-containing protein
MHCRELGNIRDNLRQNVSEGPSVDDLTAGKWQGKGRFLSALGALAIFAVGCAQERDGVTSGPGATLGEGGPPAAAADVYFRGKGGMRGIARKLLNRVEGGVPGHYIVVLDETTPAANLAAINAGQAATRLAGRYSFRHKHIFQRALRGFSAAMSELDAAALAKDPEVAYVVEDAVVRTNGTETNPPWGLDRIGQRNLPGNGVYSSTPTGQGVNVYVVDTGILPTHVEFGGRATADFDAVDDGRNGIDCNGHGTHVAGIIAGQQSGVAKSARVHGVRVLGCEGSGLTSDIMAALEWVGTNAVHPAVVNMSLGGSASDEEDIVVRSLIASGLTVVVSAGNDSTFAEDFSPARVTEAITVGASDWADNRSDFSNFGRVVDVFAPGSNVISAWFATTTATAALSGTSMAAPHVAGVAALYLQDNPAAPPVQVESAIVSSSTRGKIKDPGSGAANRLLYSNLTAPSPRPALLVVGNTTLPPEDAALRARLGTLGFSVTLKSGSALSASDASGKAVVVISPTVDSASVGSKLTSVATPVVSLEGFLFDDLKMTGAVQGTDYGRTSTTDALEIHDELSALAAGLRGTLTPDGYDHIVQVSTAGTRFWGVPGPKAVGLDGRPVTLLGQSDRAAVFGYEADTPMVGATAPARRVGFFADEQTVRTFTFEGWALFDAAVDWAAGPIVDNPQVITLSAAPSPARVDLSWFATGTNLTQEVHRATRSGGPYTKIATFTAPGVFDDDLQAALYNFTDSTAANGKTYYYVVIPLDTNGRPGRASREVKAAMRVPLAGFAFVEYELNGDGTLLSINVVSDADGATNIRVSRAESSAGPFTVVATLTANPGLGAPYADTNVVPDHVYYYKVQPFNAFGDGPLSAPLEALHASVLVNPVVQNLRVTPIANGLRAAWDHVLGASQYEVDVIRPSDGQLVAQQNVTDADATFATLDRGATYDLFVFPIGSFGGFPTPGTATVTAGAGSALLVIGQSPPRPGDNALATELRGNGYDVTLRRSSDLMSSDATGMDLVVVSASAVPAEVGTKLRTVTAPVMTMGAYTLPGLQMSGATAGTHFGVAGNQTTLTVDSNHPLAAGSPRTTIFSTSPGTFGWAVPGGDAVAVARTPGAVPASGTAPATVFGYERGVALVGGGNAPARRTALLVDPEAFFELTPDGLEIFRAAVRWTADPGAADPGVPPGVVATAGSSSIAVHWNGVPGASSYIVLRENLAYRDTRRRAAFADAIARVTGTSFTDTAVVAGAPYAYRVAAVGENGSSVPSASQYAGLAVVPTRPVISTVALDGAARIDIQPVTGATSLRVLRATESGGPYAVAAASLAPSTTSYTANGLTNGVPAFFTVEAVNGAGVIRSLEAYAIPHPALGAPAGLAAAVSLSQVTLAWSAIANARGYSVGRAAAGGASPTEIVSPLTTAATLTDVNVPNGKAFTYFVTALGDAETKGPASTVAATARGKALFVRAPTPSSGDVVLRDRLVALGFQVVEKADTELVTADATGNDLVVVTETVTSGRVDGKLTTVTVPVLTTEPSILDNLMMTGPDLGTDFGTTPNQTQINVVDGTHPLAAGLAGVRTTNTTTGTYCWGVPGDNAAIIGTMTSNASRATVFGYQTGFPMVGQVAPARRVGLFIDSRAATSLTADGAALYDAAVRWAAGSR